MAYDKTKTPPGARRAAKGSRTSTVEVGLTSRSASALQHLVACLNETPREEYPATSSGAARLAFEEAAAARGWKPPKE